jgi:hypothetical protein
MRGQEVSGSRISLFTMQGAKSTECVRCSLEQPVPSNNDPYIAIQGCHAKIWNLLVQGGNCTVKTPPSPSPSQSGDVASEALAFGPRTCSNLLSSLVPAWPRLVMLLSGDIVHSFQLSNLGKLFPIPLIAGLSCSTQAVKLQSS